MTFTGFPKQTIAFLSGLGKNNRKDWFEQRRQDYERFYVAPALAFVEAIGPKLRRVSKSVRFEPRINGSLFRIHRDTRFSKDKTPYKAHVDLWFWEGEDKSWSTPGFFFRLLPKTLILGAGMHQLDKPALDAFRKAVVDPKKGPRLEKLLASVSAAGPYAIGGASRKTVPRGFDKDHPRASLLLHEGLFAALDQHHPKELSSAAFVDWCAGHFAKVAPVSEWLRKNLS